jgi:chlorobactene glucosyltransferase
LPGDILDFVTGWSWAAVWFWMLCLIALVWLRRHLQLNRAHLEPILSPRDADGPADALPTLTVLVAAKDEEANIGRCIESLLAQDYPRLQIVAANDRSGDRTGEILDGLAQRDPRLKVVHVRELPAGWAGKNNAMNQAVAHATGDVLLLTDADCTFHDRRTLHAAVRFAQRENVELLSVLPLLEAGTFWERVVQPPAGAVMVYWFPPQAVNNPASPTAYANGAFMLMTHDVYRRLGGHAEARQALNEDMHFACVAKRRGVRLRVIRGGGLYSVRMYVGLRQIWNGWTRIFYCCFGTLPRLIVSVLFLAIFSILPTLSLLLSPLAGSAAGGIALAAGAAVLAQQTVLWRFYRVSQTPSVWALTYPLGAAVCLAVTLNAMRRYAGATTNWRGTSYVRGHLSQAG